MDVQLIRRQSLVIGLLMLSGLTACQPSRASASAASPTYPVIPIPVHAALQGYGVYDNALGDISFYADNVDYPKGQGNGFYNQLLRQYGWEPCEGEEDYCYFQFVTDMDFVGAYQFGRGPTAPRLIYGINVMHMFESEPESGWQVNVTTKNCGTFTETLDPAEHSTEGCVILLMDETTTPQP